MTLTVCYLNTWASCRQHELWDFIETWKTFVDVFCFSEVMVTPSAPMHAYTLFNGWIRRLNSGSLLQEQLTGFQPHFKMNSLDQFNDCQVSGHVYKGVRFGNVLFTNKQTVTLVAQDHRVVHQKGSHPATGEPLGQNLNMICVEKDAQRYVIGHLHGLWIKGNTKGDAPERNTQSEQVLAALQRFGSICATDHVIFGGDLNLDRSTEAISILESGGLENLNRTFGVENTRTPLYREWGKDGESMDADYVFTNKPERAQQLAVVTGMFSDHAALIVTVA